MMMMLMMTTKKKSGYLDVMAICVLMFCLFGENKSEEKEEKVSRGNWLESSSPSSSSPSSPSSSPGIAMEYKVNVDGGKEDCYWQYVHPGATFYVSYQVLKGGDGAIGFAVRRPDGRIIKPYEWKASAEFEETAGLNKGDEGGGYYSVCLDNQFSKFSAKLVNLYMTTFRYDEWEKFAQDLQDIDSSVKNFTQTLSDVDRRIQVMRQFQQLSRGLESRDYNLLLANASYVQNWSLLGCVVVIASGITQVLFLKKLFHTKLMRRS